MIQLQNFLMLQSPPFSCWFMIPCGLTRRKGLAIPFASVRTSTRTINAGQRRCRHGMKDVVVVQQRILLIDDDLIASGELASDLSRYGAQVTRAFKVAEATRLALSRDADFDSIIMETKLPDGDGFALCASFRK